MVTQFVVQGVNRANIFTADESLQLGCSLLLLFNRAKSSKSEKKVGGVSESTNVDVIGNKRRKELSTGTEIFGTTGKPKPNRNLRNYLSVVYPLGSEKNRF